MRLGSFQLRLLLWSWALILGALLASYWYSASTVADELVHDTEERGKNGIVTIKWLLQEHPHFEGYEEFDTWVTGLGRRIGARITYIVSGRVVADSGVPYEKLSSMDDHATRPEVLKAADNEYGANLRYSDTLKRDMLYVASKSAGGDGIPAGVLRVAVPFSSIQERFNGLRGDFLIILFLTMAGTMLVAVFFSRRMSGSISILSDMASAIGGGDYAQRIRVYPGGEFRGLAESVNAMADRIEKHIKTIEDQKGELKAVFEGMADGVLVVGAEGLIEAYNKALVGMFPNVEGSEGRMPIEALGHVDIQRAVDSLIGSGAEEEILLQIETKGRRALEVSIVSFHDQYEVRKLIFVFHDVSVAKRNELILRDFVTNVSHQLKTPLTSIKGYCETLIDMPPKDPEKRAEFMGTILSNADHMSNVITGMLSLAKSERAEEGISVEPLDVRTVSEEALSDVAYVAGKKGVSFDNQIPESLAETLANRDIVRHVFLNLLENAVKYGPGNSTVTMDAYEEGDHIVVGVFDEGEGIPRKEAERIFEPFYRVDANEVKHDGSAGLGLSICRKMLANIGGSIWLEESGDEDDPSGTEFRFYLKKA